MPATAAQWDEIVLKPGVTFFASQVKSAQMTVQVNGQTVSASNGEWVIDLGSGLFIKVPDDVYQAAFEAAP